MKSPHGKNPSKNFFGVELRPILGASLFFAWSLGVGFSPSAWGDSKTGRVRSDLLHFSTEDLVSFAEELEAKWRQLDPGFSIHSRQHWLSRVSAEPIGYVPSESPERRTELEEMRQQNRLDHFNTPAQFVNFFRTESSQIFQTGHSMQARKKIKALGISLMSPGFQPLFSFAEAVEADHHRDILALDLGREPLRIEFLIDPQISPQNRILLTHQMLQESLQKLRALMAQEIFIILPRHDFFARATLEFSLFEAKWKRNPQFREVLREEDRLFARQFLAYQAPTRFVDELPKLSSEGLKVIQDRAYRQMETHLGDLPFPKGSAALNLIFSNPTKGGDKRSSDVAMQAPLAMDVASRNFLNRILETAGARKKCSQWRPLF